MHAATNETDVHGGYRSPLESRNASPRMRAAWSARRKFGTWRRIWLALAEAQHELGLPVSAAQVKELGAHLDDIDFAAADAHEARLRHDVMAHVHAYGDAAPGARGIIHLGATSQDVVCNADTLVMRDALQIVAENLPPGVKLVSPPVPPMKNSPEPAFMKPFIVTRSALPVPPVFVLPAWVAPVPV
jgi:adenylosuccinate lyase